MCADRELWAKMLIPDRPWSDRADDFLRDAKLPLEAIRIGLRGTVDDVFVSLGLIGRLPLDDRARMLTDVLRYCMTQKFGASARKALATYPRDWLEQNLESGCRAVLQDADNLDYTMLLATVRNHDLALAIQLATEALNSADEDICEVAKDFLDSESGQADRAG